MQFRNMLHYTLAVGALVLPMGLSSDEGEAKKLPTKEELFSQESIDKLSETYGHQIYKSLDNPAIKLNPKAVVKGIQQAIDGKKAPMDDKDFQEALGLIQQYAYEDMANKNLAEAEELLKKHAKEDGMVVLEDGKVMYKILQPGEGEEVTEETMPTINYDATFSNGQKLGSSEQTGGPIEVKLTDTIPGFRKGILGMKVGEKRRIYIHPDMGFGKSGQLPNGLLMFDIEVTKVSPLTQDADDEDMEDDDDDLSDLLGSTDEFDDEEDDDDDEDDDLNYYRMDS